MNFQNFEKILKRKLQKYSKEKIVFVCIGTMEVLSDSIGPRIGSLLKLMLKRNMVLGDCKNPVVNINDAEMNIRGKTIIAIDSAIYPFGFVDEIFVVEKPIIMGKALKKDKGRIGNVGIKIPIKSLEMNDEKYVVETAKNIAKSIVNVI